MSQDYSSMIDPERERKVMDKIIEHPLEETFGIERGSTVVTVAEARQTQLVEDDQYDEKDKEIESNFQEVYDKAMDAFDDMQEAMNNGSGKISASQQEVSVLMLNVALNSAKEKMHIKIHKDKLRNSPRNGNKEVDSSGNVNNTNITITSSDLIKMMHAQHKQQQEKVIEVEPEPVVTRTTMPRKTVEE
jgi:hypothetical protein